LDTDRASELFRARAGAARKSLAGEDTAVAELCRQLDGLPLAIELAAARTAVLSAEEILSSLERERSMLRNRERGAPTRHSSLDTLLDWSYRLLNPGEQRFFRALGLFAGSFTIEAASIAGDIDQSEGGYLIWELLDHSLVARDAGTGQRFVLLETVREYARHRSVEADEALTDVERLGRWYLSWIGPEHGHTRVWIGDMQTELANIRQLIRDLATADREVATRLACSIARYHVDAGTISEGVREIDAFAELLRLESLRPPELLTSLAELLAVAGNTDRAEAMLVEVKAQPFVEPDWQSGMLEGVAGLAALHAGRADDVLLARLEQAQEAATTERGRARIACVLGICYYEQGDLDQALVSFLEQLACYERLNDPGSSATAHCNVADCYAHLGRPEKANFHQRIALAIATDLGMNVEIASILGTSAHLAAAHEDWATAIKLYFAHEELSIRIGYTRYPEDRRRDEEMLATARTVLSQPEVEAAEESGRALDTIAAADLAARVFAT
jgi:non-specific serine/threonine protein kinase